jgi:YcaO-like protein with predicted kinase domain
MTLSVVDVERLPMISKSVFDNQLAGRWIKGTDLSSGRQIIVPFDSVSMNFTTQAVFTGLQRSSNGLASGNHRLEAVCHGLCEVIERDAEALWRAGPDLRRVDLGTVTDPLASRLLKRIRDAGAEVAVWDITSDIDIRAYGCTLLEDPEHGMWRSVGVHDGFGCHPSATIALIRAVTEACQTRLAHISGSRDDIHRADLDRVNDPELARRVRSELSGIPATTPMRPENNATRRGSFAADADWILDRLARTGHPEAVMVDLTRDDVGIPVVKVLVPGLEGLRGCQPGPRAQAVM